MSILKTTTWQLTGKDEGDLSFSVNNSFMLVSIKDGIADIESHGIITSDTSSAVLVGYDVVSNLTGQQQGSYSMDIHTGMMVRCKVSADIEGRIQMMGRDISVKMSTGVKMDGKKVQS